MAADRRELSEWHRTRTLAYFIYKMNTGDKNPKTAEQIMPLPGDSPQIRGEELTKSDVLRSIKLYSNGNATA